MLEPTNRFMLVDVLRPPIGHVLDTAVGTTFTLDLDALLLASVSFAVFDRLDTEDGRPDPVALLESVRRHADNITVFAQAGALSGPRSHPPILSFLEESVVPVKPPKPGHLFHPKVWALRFVDPDGLYRYRLAVLSRNLTFDASWDTVVILDGAASAKAPAYSSVVGDFVQQLPSLALHRLDHRRTSEIDRLADELRAVVWEKPPDVKWMRFHPLGPSFKSPRITGERVLGISPFLSEDFVRTLGEAPGPNLLISRPTALDLVGSAATAGFAETYVVDSGEDLLATPAEATDEDELELVDELDVEPVRPGNELSGLHAKVFVTHGVDHNRLWLGSANATGAAFSGNVEFMIEFALDKNDWTIERFLDDGGKSCLRSMLVPYEPLAVEPQEPTELEEATRRLDSLLRDLAEEKFTVDVSPGDDGYQLDLGWPELSDVRKAYINAHNISVTVGPATRSSSMVPFVDAGATIYSASLETITSFLLIEARTKVDGREVAGRTLVNARLSGAPSDRKEQVLASVLDDPDKVLRYLLYLLAELTGDQTLVDAFGGLGAGFDWSSTSSSPPLLETLLRALAGAPGSLNRVAEFVTDLQAGASGDLLPANFADIWEPISAAREQLQ